MTGVQTCALPICFPVTIAGIVREGSIASVSDIENLEKIDMLQKQIRAPEAKALKDSEVA